MRLPGHGQAQDGGCVHRSGVRWWWCMAD
jgi:hypothetical protein